MSEAQSPPLRGLLSHQGEGDIQRFTLCCLWNPNFASTLEVVLEGKLIVRLEAVREPGTGGGRSIKEVTFDPRWRGKGPWGEGGGEVEFPVPPVFSLCHHMRVGLGKALKEVV